MERISKAPVARLKKTSFAEEHKSREGKENSRKFCVELQWPSAMQRFSSLSSSGFRLRSSVL